MSFSSKMIATSLLPELATLPLFRGVPEVVIGDFSAKAVRKHSPKGQLLFTQGDTGEHFYVTLSGWIKLFRETLSGDEAVVDIVPGGHVLGEQSVFSDNQYPYGAEVVEAAELLVLPLSLLHKHIQDTHILALNMLEAMAAYRKQQERMLEHMTLQNAPQRLGCFLLRLCDLKAGNDKAVLHLPYDKMLIAARLGIKPETFSRALAVLKDTVSLEIQGATITIPSVRALSDYCCQACSDNFPCGDKV